MHVLLQIQLNYKLLIKDLYVHHSSTSYPASKVTSLRRRIDDEIGHGDVTWTTSKWRRRVGYPSTSISPYIFDRLSTIENDHIRPDNDLYWAPGYREATIDLLIFHSNWDLLC